MVRVMFDIGAGDRFFAKRFRRRNKGKWLIFCGEPDWSDRRDREELIKSGKTGIYKVRGRYSDFHLPDQCLDVVTLNAPHPFTPPDGIENELIRCLKPGGFFFSAHPIGDHPSLSKEHFKPMMFGEHELVAFPERRSIIASTINMEIVGMDWEETIQYPASLVIQLRFFAVDTGSGSGYVYYYSNALPSLRVWQRVT